MTRTLPDASARISQVVRAEVTADPIEISAHEMAVTSDWTGAVVGFGGVVRNHDGGRDVDTLFYEAHPSADEVMEQLAADIAAKFPGVRIAVTHRVGHLRIGDTALAAAVGGAHRQETFAAVVELVEMVKANLPVWKRQFFTDGTEEWVGSL